jgi:hypothetical protein
MNTLTALILSSLFMVSSNSVAFDDPSQRALDELNRFDSIHQLICQTDLYNHSLDQRAEYYITSGFIEATKNGTKSQILFCVFGRDRVHYKTILVNEHGYQIPKALTATLSDLLRQKSRNEPFRFIFAPEEVDLRELSR